jgi:hypothetical protein
LQNLVENAIVKRYVFAITVKVMCTISYPLRLIRGRSEVIMLGKIGPKARQMFSCHKL